MSWCGVGGVDSIRNEMGCCSSSDDVVRLRESMTDEELLLAAGRDVPDALTEDEWISVLRMEARVSASERSTYEDSSK